MAEMRRRTRDRMALWGGVNGFVTVDAGKGPVSVMITAYPARLALP